MRIAVCISGQPRMIEECAASIHGNLLRGHGADFFVHFWASSSNEELVTYRDFVRRYSWLQRWRRRRINREKYEQLVENRAAIETSYPKHPETIERIATKAYRPVGMRVEEQRVFDTSHFKRDQQQIPGATRPANVLSMYSSVRSANRLRKSHEERIGAPYDWVVRCRSDLFFHEPVPIDWSGGPPDDCLLLPSTGNSRGGRNDQLAIGPPHLLDAYCDVFDFIQPYYESGGRFHPETILSAHLEARRIRVELIDVAYEIVRQAGQVSPAQRRAALGSAG